jgi:uncharacterized protein (DUF2235 family)
MALYAFDGTGNQDEEIDTSVLEFFRAYDDPLKNDDPDKALGSLYMKGIGTLAHTLVGEGVAEAFGIGGHDRVKQAIRRLRNNLSNGDTVVDICGFSRGAAIALSFANRIAHDLPQPVPIRFIGLWDVVGQFGAPGEHINAGHDLRAPRNCTKCYHAMALDETRAFFPLTRLVRKGATDLPVVEAWFRGVHSDVGGGNGNSALNWIALHWMYENARRHGLPIRAEAVAANLAHRHTPWKISKHRVDLEIPRRLDEADLLHSSVVLDPSPPPFQHRTFGKPFARIGDDGTIKTT